MLAPKGPRSIARGTSPLVVRVDPEPRPGGAEVYALRGAMPQSFVPGAPRVELIPEIGATVAPFRGS